MAQPNDPMVDAILDPMRELLVRYRAASARLAGAMHALEAQLSGAMPARRETPEQAGPQRPTIATLQTLTGDVDTLLEFQERISEIPGVLKVTVAGANEGRSTFLVELAQEPQLVVCANCGKTLVEGHPPASHGLCEDCRARFGDSQR